MTILQFFHELIIMYFKQLVIIFQIFSLTVIYGAVHLPPEIQKCKKGDPKLGDCMSQSIPQALNLFKDGFKELGFAKLEPFYVEKLELSADSEKSVRLNQKYEHVYLHGITNDVKVNKFKMTDDGTNCTWEMEIFSPSTRMEADYELTGQVLVFPINGHGKCNVTIMGITAQHKAKCEHYMKKGKSHLKLSDYRLSMSPQSCYFDFPNIIPGNEQISKEVGKTVNENSLEIFKDVKGGFEKLLARMHEGSANNVFAKIPEDELFLS